MTVAPARAHPCDEAHELDQHFVTREAVEPCIQRGDGRAPFLDGHVVEEIWMELLHLSDEVVELLLPRIACS